MVHFTIKRAEKAQKKIKLQSAKYKDLIRWFDLSLFTWSRKEKYRENKVISLVQVNGTSREIANLPMKNPNRQQFTTRFKIKRGKKTKLKLKITDSAHSHRKIIRLFVHF